MNASAMNKTLVASHAITNAAGDRDFARWYQFDPFEHRTRAECTVGALRAQATDVDTTPREYGGFDAHAAVQELDKGNATNFLAKNNTETAAVDADA